MIKREYITIKIDVDACMELETWARYFCANISYEQDPEKVNNIRRARKALCKSLKIKYFEKDEIT